MSKVANFFSKWFSGPAFWRLLGLFELILLIVDLFFPFMGEMMRLHSIIIMWLALATAEILEAINGRQSS